MTSSALRWLVALAVSTSPIAAGAQGSGKPKVVIVASKGKGGPNLAGPVKALIEKPLASKAEIVPFPAYKKAAVKAKVKPKDLGTVAGATTAGKAAGVAFVLIVEGAKVKKAMSANVTLVKVSSGEVAYNGSFPLKGKKLSVESADEIVGAVGAALIPASGGESPAPVAEVPPAPPPAPVEPSSPTLASAPIAPAEPPPAPEPAPSMASTSSTPAASSTSMSPEPSPTYSSIEPSATLTVTEPPAPAKSNKWRPGLAFSLGGLGFLRKAEIKDGASAAHDPVSYGGSVPLPAGSAKLEFYPLALGGNGSWYEGLGIEAEGMFTKAVTEVNTEPKRTVSSTVLGAHGGVSFRLVLWDSPTAIDLKLRGGYAMVKFPLKESSFPGLSFSAPYAGIGLTIPFVKQFALQVGCSYLLSATVGDQGKLIGKTKSASGLLAEAGFKLSFEPIFFTLLGRMDQYSATFSGTSTMDGLAAYTDAKLTDRYLSASLLAGIEL